jgi:hypothetical protein
MDDTPVEKLLEKMSKIPGQGGLFPRESIRTAAIEKLARPPAWKRISTLKIPVYQIAAAVVLVFFGFMGFSIYKPQKKDAIVTHNPKPEDYGLIKSSSVRIGVNVRQDRLKILCDSLLL